MVVRKSEGRSEGRSRREPEDEPEPQPRRGNGRDEGSESSSKKSRFAGSSSGFVYRGRSAADIQSRIGISGSMFDNFLTGDFPRFKAPVGKHRIRILPPTFDPKKWGNQWGIEIFSHRNVGADNAQMLCRRKMLGEDCAVCDARAAMVDDGDEDDAKALRVSHSVLAWIVDRKNIQQGPTLWNMSQSRVEDEIQKQSEDRDTGAAILIDDPNEGFDVFFERSGAREQTRYSGFALDRHPTPIHTDGQLQAEWLKLISDHPLPDCIKYFDNDYMDKLVNGAPSRKQEAEDQESERPIRGRGRPEPESEPEPEPEPEERPVRGRSRAVEPEPEPEPAPRGRSRAVPEDVVEDEPEPQPRRGRSRAEPEDEGDAPPPRSRRSAEPEPEPDDVEDEPETAPRTRRGISETARAALDKARARR